MSATGAIISWLSLFNFRALAGSLTESKSVILLRNSSAEDSISERLGSSYVWKELSVTAQR
ncbi:hypothetical protein CAL7716_024860 [Calothrix sp. PCC 7716]|nr:hypothetical protein CAL7716_024860 [Calothrix sp. PCC 7716]